MEGKDIASSLTPHALDLREIFYSNLMSLGFDSEAEEANYRIPLNSDMFAYPNKKAMEIVCYFLFCRLNPQQAFQEFRDCWPIQDKKMEQQFRKSCNSWLSKIYKEEQDSNLPRIGPSLFLSPGGDRFYELMFYFSSFVLRRVMARNHGKHGTMPHLCKKTARNPNMTRISSKSMIVQTISEKKRFFEEVQYALEVQEHWKSYAVTSTKDHRKLSREKRELERRLNSKGHASFPKDRTILEDETDALRRTKKLQEIYTSVHNEAYLDHVQYVPSPTPKFEDKVRELWLKLEAFYNSTGEKRAILDRILEGNEETFSIDGSEIHLQIPEALMTEYKHYIQMKNISNTYQAGKLNLLSLIQLCNLALHQLKEKIRQDGVQSFEQFAPFIKNEVRGHVTHLNNVQNLRSVLVNEVIPELKGSIEKLKDECYASLDQKIHSPIASLESFNFGLGLLPTTPSPAFADTATPVRHGDVIPENSLRKTPHSKDTPDVVENLTTSVREMVIKANQSDETKFDGKHISERSVEGSEAPKPFLSKIPKPINRRLSQTPDGLSGRSTAVVRRKSLSTTKKSKKTMNGIAHEKVNASTTISGIDGPRAERSAMKSIPGKDSTAKRPKKFPTVTQGDFLSDYTTPLRSGLKSSVKKNPSSARNILAEKIANAVFADEPTLRTGNSSSQSSSGENTPKDLGVADPVANLGEEPFISKDLIPRTPFKGDFSSGFLKDDGGDDLENLKAVIDPKAFSPTSARISSEQRPLCPQPSLKDDSFSGNSKEFSPTTALGRSPADPNVTPFNPQRSKPISISWKTPFTPHTSILNSTYSYTPIESKLTVVDINTPFGVTHAHDGTTRINQQANVSIHEISETTRSPTVPNSSCDVRTRVDSADLLGCWKFSHMGSVVQRSDSLSSDHWKLRSDAFSVSLPERTTTKLDDSLLTSVPHSTETSRLAHLPVDMSLSESKLFTSNSVPFDHKIEGSGTPLQGSISSGFLNEELFAPFQFAESAPPAVTSATIQAGIVASTSTSSAAVASPSISTASEKTSVTNDLLLRYQRLKKAQEVAKTTPDSNILDDDLINSPQPPTSDVDSRAFASPMTTPRTLENGCHKVLYGETPLLENVLPLDFNGNSVPSVERESVNSRLFLDRSPLSPSVMDSASRPFSLNSPLVQGVEKNGHTLLTVDNILEGEGLNLISVETGDLLDDQLVNNGRIVSVGKIPEDNEQPRPQTQQDSALEIMNDDSHPLETVQSVDVGQLIDID